MSANHAVMETSPGARALEMVARIEALAMNEEWSRTEHLVERVKVTVLEVPDLERRQILVELGHCLDRVRSLALSSRNEVTEKLSGIRRGQVATRAYGQPERSKSPGVLG